MRPFGKTKRIHFVGIGGIGMSGIAELLLNLGYEVSGSDLRVSQVTRRLAGLGAAVFEGHRAEHTLGADVVVFSSAVAPDNPELVAARELAIPVIPRAEMLAELMRLKYGIAVAGAHGKTTATSMVASILTNGGLDPTVVIGGRLDIWGGSNAKPGQGPFLVAEADESDGSFLVLSPTIAVVTNIDREHMDHYRSLEALYETFVQFINKVPFYGVSVLCLDNEEIQNILPRLKKRCLTYGMTSQADLRAKDLQKHPMAVSFEVLHLNRSLGRVMVGMPGEHNVLNALAAIGVALELDLGIEVIRKGLENLGGLARRFQRKGTAGEVQVVDDYGHHPTEIMAVLRTARDCWPDNRIVVLFQPHRYSRTKDLYDRFVVAFNEADVLIIAPIYPAGERPIPGVNSVWLAQGIKERGHKDVHLCPEDEDPLDKLMGILQSGDVLITLGAGDIHRVGERALEKLDRKP
ncbi:UDP-N-acetylmuramate--L-alanine ligase [Desulfatiglans anilini]|uniref:UDP-N-acetylmuramate--L-alanine ligase n=1 Tax=Desulfatiglans anilini TaxID=90728 RepID=UPI0004095F0F|nr:UDP-N-acetylmuramate--L-alanine ligase [Desulfatiglans anilini]